MKVLVLGVTGMLGHKACQVLSRGFDVTAAMRGAPEGLSAGVLDSVAKVSGVDAGDEASLSSVLDRVRPDAVVNCIGVVKQLKEGKDPETCVRINSLYPHVLHRLCRARGVRLVHVSTDCVFSGRKGAYRESDPSDAEDVYGRSKFLGEVAGPGAVTLRTSIIGRELSVERGLVEWFLSQRGRKVKGFTKAVFSGLTTLELSKVIRRVLADWVELEGLYHVAAEPVTKFDLLKLIRDVYRLDVEIEPDDSLACDRSLDGSRFREATGYVAPSWPEMIRAMAEDPTPYEEIRKQARS
ncbi:MAG: SDR family oxidoreductase [Lentisphaerae bacterium]|nr:SDR family oxidoreductase [Lentisphaerota bacterium]